MASTYSTERSRGSRARIPLRLSCLTLALCAAAAYPAYRFGGRESVLSMLLGAGLSWMTITLSYLLLAWIWRRSRQLQVALVTAGFLVRVALLFGLLAWIARTFVVNLNQLVLWLVVFYFVLVVAEARELAAAERQRSQEA